jgi:hypothetical protein
MAPAACRGGARPRSPPPLPAPAPRPRSPPPLPAPRSPLPAPCAPPPATRPAARGPASMSYAGGWRWRGGSGPVCAFRPPDRATFAPLVLVSITNRANVRCDRCAWRRLCRAYRKYPLPRLARQPGMADLDRTFCPLAGRLGAAVLGAPSADALAAGRSRSRAGAKAMPAARSCLRTQPGEAPAFAGSESGPSGLSLAA